MRYLICAFISLVLFACFGARAETAKTTFIAEELKFLKGHGPIKYCIDPYWKPLEFRDKNNQHQGLSADFIKLFAKNSGIEFEFVPTKTWRESLRFLKDRHCDILTLAMPTKERMKYMAFTTPYVDFPLVIATKSDVSFISDFRKVLDKTFAVVKGYALVDEIQKKYKGVKLIEASDVTQGLEYVRLGKAFGFIDTVATIAHAVKEENLIELKIAGKLEEEWPLGVGVRNDLPTLLSIMQKNVAYISDGEKQTILNRWIAVRYEKGFDYQLFWKLLAAIVFIGLFLLFRYRELSRINAKLTRSEKRYRALFESSGDAIYLIRDGRYVDCNSAAVNLYGFSREEIIGVEPYQLSPQFQPGGRLSSDVANEKITSALSGQPQLVEWQSMREDGSLVDTEVILTAVEIGEVPHLLANVRDVTERKQSEEKIEHLAFYDQLTAIPNRSFFLGCLEQQIKECRATGHFAAILLTDVLNFNLINNSLGHRNGDELLKQIAHRLVQCEGEAGTVARLGGDIFAFLFPNIGETKLEALAGVELITVKIFRAFEETFTVGGVVQHCRAVIGATLIGTDAGTPEELLSEVELAAEVGKREKDDTVKLYDPQLQSLASRRAQIEESLRQAIGQSEFELHYQPQLSMGKLVGLEALIRWRQPENGMISPGEFIPISEETGLIIPIGDWVMREACEQIKRWEKHPVLSGVPVAVNISAAQMTLQNFVGRALNIITQTKASPRMLKFELTESALARDSDNAVEKMWALRAAGIQFSLDDFGTGYSSLGYLKRLPIDQIKIDQSFVRDLLTDVDDATIAKTIINLARDFGMNVIAEGVETEAQQRFLENLGCHTYQGYLFARPMPANELEEYAAELA